MALFLSIYANALLITGRSALDYLHAKAASDIQRKALLNEDEFYAQHCCDWFNGLKKMVMMIKRARWRGADTHDANDAKGTRWGASTR